MLMNFQQRPLNITKLARRSFRCPFGPDAARSRNRISEGHKSRKIGTGKIVGVKKKMIERRDRKRKGGYQKIKILLALSHASFALCMLADECGPKE